MTTTAVRPAIAAAVCALSTSAAFAQAPAPAAASASAPAPAAAANSAAKSDKLAWYGRKFAGRKTASGEAFDPEALTMAHKTLPFGTLVKITHPKNGKSVTVRVNDRGPAHAGRVGDVSLAAARKLGILEPGVIEAELSVVGTATARKR